MESDSRSGFAKLKEMGDLSVPPGFVSRTSFILKRGKRVKEIDKSTTFLNESEHEPIYMDTERGIDDIAAYNQILTHRPWILFDQSNHKPEKSHTEHLPMVKL